MLNRCSFELVWRVKTRLAERKGTPCRMLIRARRMNSCLIEFEDGYRVVTSVNYVRKGPTSRTSRTGSPGACQA